MDLLITNDTDMTALFSGQTDIVATTTNCNYRIFKEGDEIFLRQIKSNELLLHGVALQTESLREEILEALFSMQNVKKLYISSDYNTLIKHKKSKVNLFAEGDFTRYLSKSQLHQRLEVLEVHLWNSFSKKEFSTLCKVVEYLPVLDTLSIRMESTRIPNMFLFFRSKSLKCLRFAVLEEPAREVFALMRTIIANNADLKTSKLKSMYFACDMSRAEAKYLLATCDKITELTELWPDYQKVPVQITEEELAYIIKQVHFVKE